MNLKSESKDLLKSSLSSIYLNNEYRFIFLVVYIHSLSLSLSLSSSSLLL
jgi:hypothetical protein